ncbi:MAG: hypothetical protein JNG90_11130, partial [Planctomycetaceae bacterium]|nr:hypothetical protein [Planctomycetaceae bacterium]
MSRELPSELIARQAERLGRGSADPVALAAELNGELERRVAALVAQLRGGSGSGSAADLAPYRARAWQCVAHHVDQFLESRAMSFSEVLDQLEKGQLAYGPVGVNVLAEVVLAQGLEQGEPAAARRFESDYMPAVRQAARKVGGERAIDAVDNFAAELVLPREDRASRLSTFVGRTPLATWLRTVVVNYWITQTRRERYERPGEIP